MFIGHRHQDHTPNTRLQILVGEVSSLDALVGEVWGEHAGERCVGWLDRHGEGFDTEVGSQVLGVGHRMVA